VRLAALYITLFAAAFFCSAAQASDIGIAMNGEPKYKAGFDHLEYVNPDAPKGGELRISFAGSFDSLNSHIVFGEKPDGLEYLSDKLMQRAQDEPFTLYGLVAESIDVAPDRSWITFHLRKEARFHDGVAMTSDDVKFSFEKLRENGVPVQRRVFSLVNKVETPDAHTITFRFGPGYDHECVMILALMPVLPKHYWEKHDISKTTLEPPLGSGPYKIASVDPGRQLVLERVKDYWAKDLPVNKGYYNFDKITYIYFRDDEASLQALANGYYNFRHEFDISKWLTQYDFKSVVEGKLVKEEIPNRRPAMTKAFVFNLRHPVFADRRVREALSLIFNGEWIDKTFYFGKLQRTASVFANSELAASGKPEGEELRLLNQYKADLPPEVFGNAWQPPSGDMRERQRRAIGMLKEAGWNIRNGQLVNAKGEPFRFEILLEYPEEQKIALEYVRDLAKIGVTASIRLVDSAQFIRRLEQYDYDMVSYRWSSTLSPGNEQTNFWGTKSADIPGARNYAGIKNPAIDALADSIGRSTDRETLVARCHAIDRALMYGYYMIPLFYFGADMVAHTTDIHRPGTTPASGMVLESWWHQDGDKAP
jgi:microcin C transport system substrate-binding protein